MQVKQYIKGVAKAVLDPVVKSLGGSFPALGAGMYMTFGNTFRYNWNGMTAYNNKIYYAAQNLLVNKLIETPVIFNKRLTKDTSRKLLSYYSAAKTNEQRKAIKETSFEEQENHPLNELFEKGNSYQSPMEIFQDFWHNYGFGDGYLWFETIGNGLSRNTTPIAIHSLNKLRVNIMPSYTESDGIAYYKYTTRNGRAIDIPKDQIFHLKKWNPQSQSLLGFDPSQVVAAQLALDLESEKAQGAAYVNGGRGTMFSSDITLDKDGEIVEKMTAEQMDTLKDEIESDFKGTQNYRRMHYTNGYVNAQNFGDTMAEMEISKTNVQQWEFTYATLGIPDVLCPTTKASTESNVQAGYKALVTNTIVPMLRLFDSGLTKVIQKWYPGIVAIHDITEFNELAPDLKLMMEVYGKPKLRVDEGRKIFGYDKIGGEIGNAILVDSGQVRIEDIVLGMDDTETDNELDVL